MKHRIQVLLWSVVLGSCFLFWISGISHRLFAAAFGTEPLRALFHPDSVALTTAENLGYGAYARFRVLFSLFDRRFLMMAAVFLTGVF